MATINVLEKEIFNRIAAGEVVEGPKSIVKELAENAIDAGASSVSIEIAGGGIDSIVVADNGSGIPNSEVRKAFLPHATSKIKTAEDMETIGTLGFRGEALPSIAAVAKVVFRTKWQSEEAGTLLKIKGGEEKEFGACALERGTVAEVRSLFFNTPARFKFLKSARSEESYVDAVVQGLILANPNVAIRYTTDGALKLASDGNGFKAAVSAVYPSIFKRFLRVSRSDGAYRVVGYVSEPGLSKGNRSGQTIVLNGRVVGDSSLSATVQNAYRERLMTRSFPFFVLDIVMPFDEVDVNVHPAKAEVRLRDPRKLYGVVYRAVKDALERNDRALQNAFLNFSVSENANDPNPKNIAEKSSVSEAGADLDTGIFREFSQSSDRRLHRFSPDSADFNSEISKKESLRDEKSDQSNAGFENRLKLSDGEIKNYSSEADFDAAYAAVCGKSEASSSVFRNSAAVDSFSYGRGIVKLSENQSELPSAGVQNNLFHEEACINNPSAKPSIRVVGQIFQCYLIVECGEKGFLIDQHAAHERTIYDRLMRSAQSETAESQPLLIPYVFEGSSEECDFILTKRDALSKIGFEIEEFGNKSIKAYAVPSVLSGIDFNAFFRELLGEMSAIKSLKTEEILKKRLATIACKSAIKAGDALTPDQIAYFIEVYISSGAPILCPHGRPTILPFDKIELEKRFKRKL